MGTYLSRDRCQLLGVHIKLPRIFFFFQAPLRGKLVPGCLSRRRELWKGEVRGVNEGPIPHRCREGRDLWGEGE